MAFTITARAETGSTSNVASYASASYTPSANRLLVAFTYVTAYDRTLGATFSGNGLTWTQQDSSTRGAGALFLFTALTGSSPSTGAGTLTLDASDPATGCFIGVYEFDGVDLTTPVVQTATNAGIAAATTPTLTFGATTQSDSAIIAMLASLINPPNSTPPSGWTEQLDTGHASPNTGYAVAYHLSPGALTTVTWGNLATGVTTAMGIEIAAAVTDVNGNGASTLSALTQAAEGDTIVAATGASTLTGLTQAAEGDVVIAATGASTLSALTQAAVAQLAPVSGNGASTLTALEQAATGTVLVAGTGASTLTGLTQAATGATIVSATGASTLTAATQSAEGDTLVAATGSSTLSGLTQAAEGDVLVAATGAQTLTGPTQAATGTVLVQATGASTLPPLEQAATGTVAAAGAANANGASTLSALTQAAEADAIVSGTGASTLPLAVAHATDTFDRANGPLGTTETGGYTWVDWYGAPVIESNELGGTAAIDAAYIELGTPNHYVAGDLGTTGNIQLGLRIIDQANRLGVFWSGPTTLNLYQVLANVNTTLLNVTMTRSRNVRAEVVGRTVRLYVEGALVGTVSTVNAALDSATKVAGVTTPGVGFDDFAAGPVQGYGAVTVSATGASTLAPLTEAAEGDVLVQGTGQSALESLTGAATGTVVVSATGATVIPSLEQAATGTAGAISAEGVTVLPELVGAGVGTVAVTWPQRNSDAWAASTGDAWAARADSGGWAQTTDEETWPQRQ